MTSIPEILMRIQRLMFITACGLLISTSAFAQQAALSCKDIVIPVAGASKDVAIAITLSPADLIGQCTSASGAPLTLVTPSKGITVTPTIGANAQTLFYTVKDNLGNQVTAKVVVSRN